MKRAIIVASQKGGLGKSFTARAFVDLARRAGRRVSAWDLDKGTGSLAIVYKDRDPEVGCATDDIRHKKTEAGWIDAFHGAADDVVLDVPGGAMADLLGVVDGGALTLVEDAKQAGRDVLVVSVIGTQRDSTATPLDAIDAFEGTSVHHVVVKNGYHGDESDFVIFDGFNDAVTGERRFGSTSDKVREVGGEVVFMPRLNAATVAMLDVYGLTFTEGSVAAEKIKRRHALNAAGWLRVTEEAFSESWLRASDSGAKKGKQHGRLAAV
jgi:hypothetical protein